MKKWQQLEEWICLQLKNIDPYVRRTKGSGNQGEKGDLKFSTNIGLHIEAKQRNLLSVYNQRWLDKCNEEIPLHVNKIALLITENKEGKKVAHLNAEDFFNLFKKGVISEQYKYMPKM